MLKPCTTFACKTDDHNRATEGLSRCADLLYEWLLRQSRAGSPAEIHLEAFQDFQQHRFKGRGYSLAWIKQALRELVDVKLVDIAFKFSSKIFKLITWHPDRQSAADLKKNLESARKTRQNSEKNREKPPSNPYPVYSSYIEIKEFKETTNKTTTHPVLKNQQGEIMDPPVISKTPELEIEPTILQKIETAGFKINSTLNTIVRSTQSQIVLQAIEAAQQYITKLQQKNQPLRRQPEALLVSAIREEWKSAQVAESRVNTVPPEFHEWLKSAQAANLVSNSSVQADVTSHPPGVLCVLTISGDWVPYGEMQRLHSLTEVKKLAADRQAKMVFTPSPRMHQIYSSDKLTDTVERPAKS
jgi:hypothetical protein